METVPENVLGWRPMTYHRGSVAWWLRTCFLEQGCLDSNCIFIKKIVCFLFTNAPFKAPYSIPDVFAQDLCAEWLATLPTFKGQSIWFLSVLIFKVNSSKFFTNSSYILILSPIQFPFNIFQSFKDSCKMWQPELNPTWYIWLDKY